MTEHNPAPSPSGHPLLSGPPTLTDIHQIFTRFSSGHVLASREDGRRGSHDDWARAEGALVAGLATMGQGGSTAECGCIESILTGSTKREQFLEQQCTELARQNELLRNRLEQSRSGDAADSSLSLSRQSSGNHHHRQSLSAYKSLGGSSSNLAAAAAPSTANLYSVAEGSPGSRADTAANRRRSERSSTKMEPGQLATLAVAAAAQEVADYQSSLVSVSINNEAYETKTEVTNRGLTEDH